MSEVAAARAAVNETLREELLAMEKEDQQIRREIIAAGAAAPDSGLVTRLQAIDSSNTTRLKEIVGALGGWPSVRLVGQGGADAAFLITQHADQDPAFQKRMLPLLRKAYEKGEAGGQQVAFLTDRVRTAEGREQLYGTQTYFEDGEIVCQPIAERDEVDERRATMGMTPPEEYAAFLREMYQQRGDAGEDYAP